jgi:hypothetical protein
VPRPPDGYTLLMASIIVAVKPTPMPNLSYETPKDFDFIARIEGE